LPFKGIIMEIRSIGNNQTAPAIADNAPAPASPALESKPAAAPVEPEAAVQQPGTNSSAVQVAEALKSINNTIQTLAQNVEFSIDEDSDRAIVKVIDRETKEVIRQMPTKEALEIAKALDRVQGLLIRQQA
jgi:flagellar protein FlaG